MAGQNDQFQSNETFEVIEKWLISYFLSKGIDKAKEQALDKIKEKIAKKLGYSYYVEIIGGNFPAAKLASFGSSMLKGIWYEGYYIANGQFLWNQSDPAQKDQQDAYVEYLLYSWGRYLLELKLNNDQNKKVLGGPGYIYNKLKW